MSTTIRISVPTEAADALTDDLEAAGLDINPPVRRVRGVPDIVDILVTLSSAGTLTLIYRTLTAYLGRNKNHEITCQVGDKQMTIKGHSMAEEKDLINLLEPEKSKDGNDSGN